MSSLTEILLNIPGPGETLPIIEPPPPEANEPIPELPMPRATGPSSQIDPTLPVYGNPTTQSVRQNFATAQVEITGLMQNTVGAPFLPLSGAKMTGPMYLYNDPTDVMMPVTLGYFQTHGGDEGGGGGIPEAPSDGMFYLRSQGAWVPGVALSGGTVCQMTGELLLAGNPADALGAVPKQYADAIGTTANGAVKRAGDTMTGLLLLSGDPTAPLGAVTKQYADAGLALKAPINNPTFTGVVNTAGRIIATAAAGPSLTLYDTTTNAPCFGIYNAGGYLGFGLATPSTGNPNGNPFATMDQNGNFLFATRVNVTGGRLISSLGTSSPTITLNHTALSHIFGLAVGNVGATNSLMFGLMDASGALQSVLTSMDFGGNWAVGGGTLYLSPYIAFTASSGNLNIGPASGQPAMSIGLFAANGVTIASGGSLTVSGWVNVTGNSGGSLPNGIASTSHIRTIAGNLVASNTQNPGVCSFATSTGGSCGIFSGSGNALYFATMDGNGNFTGVRGNIDSAGNMGINGVLGQGSDARLKENIEDAPDGHLAAIRRMMPKRYNRLTSPDRRELGLVAQDILDTLPEAVCDMPQPQSDSDELGSLLGIEPMALIAALVGAVNELAATVEGMRR